MLKLILVYLFGALCLASVSAKCNACIKNQCYTKTTVLKPFQQIGQIDVDRTANIVYFHVQNDQNKSFTCAYELDNNIRMVWLSEVEWSFARTVDQTTRDVYISTVNSVVKTNPNNFEKIETVFEKPARNLQFKDKLYYNVFFKKGIQIFENDEHKDVEGLSSYNIQDFIVDKNNDIYFLSNNQIYRLKNREAEAELFANDIYALATDIYGEAYMIQAWKRGIFKVDYTSDIRELVKIGAFGSGVPYKVAFTSSNNIVYSDARRGGIYYLTPSRGACEVKAEINGTRELITSVTVRQKSVDKN